MNILITGKNSIVSKELYQLLKNKKKFKIFLSTRKKFEQKNNILYINSNKKINIKKKIHTVIHCASNHPYTFSNKSKRKLEKENIAMCKKIDNFCNSNKIKKIIFISAINTYGTIEKKDINENYKPKKPSWYGRSKLEGEKIFLNKKNNYKCICLRVPGIFTKDLSKDHPLIINLIKKLLKNSDIIAYNKNGLFNNIIDTLEIYKIIIIFLKKDRVESGKYNLATRNPIKFSSVIQILKKIFSSKSKIKYIKNKKKPFLINIKKIEKNFNIRISTTYKVLKRNSIEILKSKKINCH